MVGPDYVRPEADVNGSWLEASAALSDIPEAMIEEMRERTNWGNVLVDP